MRRGDAEKFQKIKGFGLRASCAPDMIAPSREVLSFARLFSFFITAVRNLLFNGRESHASRTRGGASF